MTTAPDDAPDEEEALVDLYARWSPLVYSVALRSLGDVAQAEEVTRRVFTRARASRDSVGPTRARVPDALVELTRAAVADLRAGSGRLEAPPARTTSENSASRESKTDMLAERMVVVDGLSRLDTSSRRVLQLALDRDLTLGEVAGRTGLRVEEVRSRAARGLMELRERLEAQADAH